MARSNLSIHQFAIDCTPGDGISNGMFFTRKLLRLAGVHSEIYCADIHPQLADETIPMERYRPGEAQALLIHHGIGNRCEDWLRALPEAKFMVFHNITPGELFAADHPIQPDLSEGWRQVGAWRHWLTGALADSPRNMRELLQRGHDPARLAVIPLLVDLQAIQAAARPAPDPGRPPTLLFVGRVMPHKNQIALVEALAELQRISCQPARLLLVGGFTVPEYRDQVRQRIAQLGLDDHVTLTGKVDDAQLQAFYRQADVFVCLSRHEGFGMPLIEAMAHGLPVLAYDAPASNIADTLGGAGVLLHSADPTACAQAVFALLRDQPLLARLNARRLQRLEEFAYQPLYERLRQYLGGFGIQLPPGNRDRE